MRSDDLPGTVNPAVVFPKPNEVVFEDRRIPSPGPGQVLLRTRRTLISTGTELTILSGDFPPRSRWSSYAQFPFTGGTAQRGMSSRSGGVTTVAPGDRVAMSTGQVRFASQTMRARFASRSPRRPRRYALYDVGPDRHGRGPALRCGLGVELVVYGAGLLGQLAARFCRLAGARPVIVVDVAKHSSNCCQRTWASWPSTRQRPTFATPSGRQLGGEWQNRI